MLKYLNVKSVNRSCEKKSSRISDHQRSFHLKQLVIDQFADKVENFGIFVKQTPNFKSLTFISDNNNNDTNIIDGKRWEYLIISSMPKLNTFNFIYNYYEVAPYFRSTHQIKIDKFQPFHYEFWKEQHHWCFAYIEEDRLISFYTIPYISDTYQIQYNFTNSSNDLINSFANVKNMKD